MTRAERIAAAGLSILPLVVIPLVALRSLRHSSAYLLIGLLLFGLELVAARLLWNRVEARGPGHGKNLGIAGLLLSAPFSLMALAWIGLGTPFEATAAENQLRYLVLAASAIMVTLGSGILKECVHEKDKQATATLAATLMSLAGVTYVVWFAWELGGVGAPRSRLAVG